MQSMTSLLPIQALYLDYHQLSRDFLLLLLVVCYFYSHLPLVFYNFLQIAVVEKDVGEVNQLSLISH